MNNDAIDELSLIVSRQLTPRVRDISWVEISEREQIEVFPRYNETLMEITSPRRESMLAVKCVKCSKPSTYK